MIPLTHETSLKRLSELVLEFWREDGRPLKEIKFLEFWIWLRKRDTL